jgi:hypothetical protein
MLDHNSYAEQARKWGVQSDSLDNVAIVFALLAIAEEINTSNELWASTMRDKGGLVVEIHN